jgi:hypothetical protein
VDLGCVSAEDVAWLGGTTGSRLALDVGRHGRRRGRRCSRAEQVLDGRQRKVGAKIAARKWLVVASQSISPARRSGLASRTASSPQGEVQYCLATARTNAPARCQSTKSLPLRRCASRLAAVTRVRRFCES